MRPSSISINTINDPIYVTMPILLMNLQMHGIKSENKRYILLEFSTEKNKFKFNLIKNFCTYR